MKEIRIIALLLPALLGLGTAAEAQRGAVQLCPVHKVRLRTATVPVVYGALSLPLAYLQDAPKYFPFANRVFYSGEAEGSQAKMRVLYCSRCRSVERNWRRQYNRTRKSGGPQPTIQQRNLFLQFLASQKMKQQQQAPRPRAK